MARVLTVKELLAQKEQLIKKKGRRKLRLYIQSLESDIVIQEPSSDLAVEALEMGVEGKTGEADIHITYHCVIEPNLKDEELQKEFGCVEPTDIVGMIFRPGEIAAISGHALQLAGYGEGVSKVDHDLKN